MLFRHLQQAQQHVAIALLPAALLSARRCCSSSEQQQQPAKQTPPRSSSSTALTREVVLTQRWGCRLLAGGRDAGSQSGRAAARLSNLSQSSVGFVVGAISRFVRQVTRRDEFEEREESLRRDTQKKAKDDAEQQRRLDTMFGGGGGEDGAPPETIPEGTFAHGGIDWAVYERLDSVCKWIAPESWAVNTRISENFVAIQCVPSRRLPSSSSEEQQQQRAPPSVHGLSVTNFMYLSKVPTTATADDLLRSFLTQFHRSVGRTSVVVGSSAFSDDDQQVTDANRAAVERCKAMVVQCDGAAAGGAADVAVCELVFRPAGPPSSSLSSGSGKARALVKAFFHRSRRRHTVVVFAVPDDEFELVKDLVQHAVLTAGELQGRDIRSGEEGK